MSKLLDDFISGISILIDKKIEKIGYTKMKMGYIKAKNSNGTYNVVIDDDLFTNVPQINKNKNLNLNQPVRVLYPNNQPSQAVILTD